MIKTLITFAILASLSGCSSKNAFTKFNMNKDQELSVSSLLSSKIKSKKDGKIDGVVSAIYLNEIYPDSYNNNEYFFVYLFLKNKKKMHDPKDFDKLDLSLRLNGELPIKIKQLENKNKFSHLTFIKSDWNRYYLVAFKKQNKTSISLVLESDQSFSDQLEYQKDK